MLDLNQRRVSYEHKMNQLELSEREKESKRRRLDRIESQYLRARRIKLTKDTFTTIQVIGRGSFGEVCRCRDFFFFFFFLSFFFLGPGLGDPSFVAMWLFFFPL
jgi:serine/threonine protein kinase